MRRGAFDRPGLGLVLQLVGALGLIVPATQLAQMMTVPSLGARIVIATAAMLGSAIVSLTAGWVISYRPRWAGAAFLAYAAAALALVVIAGIAIGDDHSAGIAVRAGIALDALGLPVVIAIVAIASTVDPARRSIGDVGAVLLVSALAGLVGWGIGVADDVRLVGGGQLESGSGWMLVGRLVSLGTLILELRAATAAVGGSLPLARRRIKMWMLVAIGGGLMLAVIDLVARRDLPTSALAFEAIQLVLIPVIPLVIWGYTRSVAEPGEPSAHRATATLGWVALAWIPPLVGRALVVDSAPVRELTFANHPAFALGLLCVTQAALQLIVGVAALRGSRDTFRYACAAAMVATALTVIAVIVLSSTARPFTPVGAIPLFWASTIALAWTAHRTRVTPSAAATPDSAS